MSSETYRAQVDLLLQVLPYVAMEDCFALKGGTAINFFIRDLARFSVDIDLTYLPFEDRQTSLEGITKALARIKTRLEKAIPNIRIKFARQSDGQEVKLICQNQSAQIKIEVNTTIRGYLEQPRNMQVSNKIQEEFGKFAQIQVVSQAELFGGKICAALDRQHPRDLFDIHLLFENEGISEEIKLGFITLLISSPRPIHEIIRPNLTNQENIFRTQFEGMATSSFSYEDYETTRERLISEIHSKLTKQDREFLLSFKRGNPNWALHPFKLLEEMPAIQWKLQNIQKLISQNPKKHEKMLENLEKILK